MTVESLAMTTVRILADRVKASFLHSFCKMSPGFHIKQVERGKKILGSNGCGQGLDNVYDVELDPD